MILETPKFQQRQSVNDMIKELQLFLDFDSKKLKKNENQTLNQKSQRNIENEEYFTFREKENKI